MTNATVGGGRTIFFAGLDYLVIWTRYVFRDSYGKTRATEGVHHFSSEVSHFGSLRHVLNPTTDSEKIITAMIQYTPPPLAWEGEKPRKKKNRRFSTILGQAAPSFRKKFLRKVISLS